MEKEIRTRFFSKLLVGGGSAAAGVALIIGGLSALDSSKGMEALFLVVLGVGLGSLFLRTAWKVFGEE